MPSNLPPGITENDIPGNRPEDEAWDTFHIEIDNHADELGLDPWQARDVWHLGVEEWKKRKSREGTQCHT